MSRLMIVASLLVGGTFLSASAAHAYIDPGTGSVLLQSLIGGVAAAFAVISLYYNRLKFFIRKFLSRANRRVGRAISK
jgi:hypothetical protein